MKRLFLACCCSTLSLAGSAASKAHEFPFPLVASAGSEGRMVPVDARVEALFALEEATLVDLRLPDGTSASLALRRIELGRLRFAHHVDGRPAPAALEGLSLSVWRGVIAGEPDSDVALSFSHAGSHGWIRRGADLFHLSSRPGEDGASYDALLLSDAQAVALGGMRAVPCAADLLASGGLAGAGFATGASATASIGMDTLYEASVAVESDYQYFQVFGELHATIVYMTALLGWVSALYEEEVGTVLTFPYVNVWTNPNDPWITPDIPGTCVDMIYEFQAAWAGQVPFDAAIGHFLSGANLGCGAGFLPGLCVDGSNFSVCGNQTGSTPFPPAPNAANLDFFVVNHEIGHNFGAIHTHDYCPPIDECAPPGYFGPCQDEQACAFPGTLMSYCHTCGGFGNIDTHFHPQSAADMRAWVESSGCLPTVCPDPLVYCTSQLNSDGCLADIGTSGNPTLSGSDDFHVIALEVVANKPGILFYGFGPNDVPMLGGTLCVAPPLIRTPPIHSGGDVAFPCDGRLDFHWSSDFMADEGLVAGTTAFAQFWYRDPHGPSGSALSDAVEFTICP